MTSLPPPDRVPMIEAPPPMSEPSPTTTPAEIRPSTIDVPSVPALKLTKPSCMTVVPLGEVGAEPDPVGVGDADAGGQRRSRPSAGTCRRRSTVTCWPGGLQPGPGRLEALDRARAGRGPHDVGEQAEDAVHRRSRAARPGGGEQVQPQPDVLGRRPGAPEVGDLDQPDLRGSPARRRRRAASAVELRRRGVAAAGRPARARGTTRRARCRRRPGWRGRSPRRSEGEVTGPLYGTATTARTGRRRLTARCGRRCTRGAGRRGRSAGRTPRSCGP